MNRKAVVDWQTNEVQARVEIDLEGRGSADVRTGVPFFDHVLTAFARHGLFDLRISAKGDLDVDAHHTVEDVGIALGQAVRQAVGEKRGINRYGWAMLPMDETLVRVALDLSGRPYFALHRSVQFGLVGSFDGELVVEFLRAFANNAGMNLHVEVVAGANTHHMVEAVFKALGRALRAAVEIDPRVEGVPSTKGKLQ